MPRWLSQRTQLAAAAADRVLTNWPRRRLFSSQSQERVQVKCGSAGSVGVDLINVLDQPWNAPLFIHLPPLPSAGIDSRSVLPKFLDGKPVASINYRWDGSDDVSSSHWWPTPIHDTLFAYSWLVEQFAPQNYRRRDIYVYGSYLGASLATSLSLTETHRHLPFAVRGFIAYNGIYNWTMFLPDHPINRPSKRGKKVGSARKPAEGAHMQRLQESLPTYFTKPADLFDSFASPSLLFHNPGLHIPSSFTISSEDSAAIEALVDQESIPPTISKPPRKSHLVFPPRKSTLRIPETLLLYDAPSIPQDPARKRRKTTAAQGHSWESQTMELMDMMRRSIEKVELKERGKWDEETDGWEAEIERRVRAVSIGTEMETTELSEVGEEAALAWLEERVEM